MTDHGLELKESIFSDDRRVERFVPEVNLYYWYTVLRQLKRMLDKKVFRYLRKFQIRNTAKYIKAVKTLEDLLKELLQKEGGPFVVLPRTADLLHAIDCDDKITVEHILKTFPNETDLLPHLMLTPGHFFPKDSRFHHFVCGSPISKDIHIISNQNLY